MQAQLYFMNGDYDKVDAVVKRTVAGLAKLESLPAKKRDDLAYTIRGLKYNALQNRAAEFIRAKEFAKVGATLAAELNALKKELKAKQPSEPSPGFERMRTAQRGFLIVCMSAYVQSKQADQAIELLDAWQGSGGNLDSDIATMRSLNYTIQSQLTSLNKEGKTQEADDLAKTFTDFLDKIKGDDTSKLPSAVIMFLGQGYGAVNQQAKAAELFEQLVSTPFKPDPKKNEQENQALAAKHAVFVKQMQFYQARACRQIGTKEGFAKATELMRKIVGDPIKKGVPHGWGYRNLEIRKEYNLLLEDQKLYGPAVNNWVRMTREFVPRGLPAPITFIGQRPMYITFAEWADQIATGAKGPMAAVVDFEFKNVFPQIQQDHAAKRLLYFDLFYEAQRCMLGPTPIRSSSPRSAAVKSPPTRSWRASAKSSSIF